MSNVIRHKRGTSNPVAGDFSQTAELLVNTSDGGLFTKTDGGSVVEIGGSDANKADVSHKYHEFGSNQYFYDNYEQGRYFRLFTENATFSVTRFRAFSNVEYYNTSTSSWTSWSGGVSGVEALLDGRQNTGMNVAHANRKFRFTVNVSSGWPTKAVYFLQSSWSAISYPGITVTLENATSASGTFTTKDTAVFTSSNTGNTWGIHARTTSSLHNGATYVRVTIDITDWTDSNNYTTVPLRNFEILSNYAGSDLLPFSWDYDQNISVSGTVDGRDLAADGSKLDGIETGATADQTASEILTAIKTVDGSGSGLDADTVDGVHASSFLRADQSTTLSSGNLTLSSGNITATNGTNKQIHINPGDGSIEITRATGGAFIDFKNSTSEDFDARLQESNGTITLNGSRILTRSDEGSGNGIDADTVDGVHASSFFQANNALSATTGAFSGDVTMSGTGALKVANGTTAQRPTPATGQIRYNTTLGALESYVSGAWQVIANTALDYGLITSASDTTFDYGALS